MAREALQCIKLALNSVSSCMDWLSYGMEPARRYLAVIDAQIYQVLYRRPRVQGAQTPSVTAFLIMLSMADLVLLVLGYPVWFTLYVLSFIGSMLHIICYNMGDKAYGGDLYAISPGFSWSC